MPNNELELVLFDFAGVFVVDAFRDFGAYEEKFKITKNAWQTSKNRHWFDLRVGKITEKEFWIRSIKDAGKEPDDDFIQLVREYILNAHIPYQTTFELARCFKSSGMKVGIMSNMCEEWLIYWDNKYGLSKLFSPIITSHKLGYAKPDSRYFSEATKRYGINPSRTLFFDDQEDNVKAAKDAGYQAVLFKPQ